MDGDLRRDRRVRLRPGGPHGGTRYAWLDGYGTTHTDTLRPDGRAAGRLLVVHPDLLAAHRLRRDHHDDRYDTLRVQVLNTGGTVLATLATYSNLNEATGYSQRSFNLAAYAGQTIQLKFTGTEDASLQTSFVVDDTALNVS